MKIKFDAVLLDFDGKEIPDTASDQETLIEAAKIAAASGASGLAEALVGMSRNLKPTEAKFLTVKDVCMRALGAGQQKENDPKKMVDYFELGMLLRPSGEIEITTDQAKILQDVVPLVYRSALISGQVCKILNG